MFPALKGAPGKGKDSAAQAGSSGAGDGAAGPCLVLVDLGSNAAMLAKGRGCFEDVFHACRPSCCKENNMIRLGKHSMGRWCGGKTSPDLPQRHSQGWESMLPREGCEQRGYGRREEPGASRNPAFKKINWKRPLCQPCTELHLCSMLRARIFLPVGPRNQLPRFGEEREWEQEANISYFFLRHIP